MGFKDRKIIRHEGFRPLLLSEGNVQALFYRCLATETTPDEDRQLSILFQREMGYDEDSTPVSFCKSTIAKEKKNILYMLGQLRSIHANDYRITAAENVYKYDGEIWTTESATMMEFYHLAEATRGITPFIKQYNHATIWDAKPTLSPKDPNFPAWWEAHKAEWEAPAE